MNFLDVIHDDLDKVVTRRVGIFLSRVHEME